MPSTRTHPEPQRVPVHGTRFGVAYYRVSTSDQANTSYDDDGFSIQAQRDYCQRKATDMGVQLVNEFVDRGKSARTAGRPGLQAMLARIKDDTDIQYVFVHKLDRLARNRHDDVQIELLFAKCGVQLVSCTENIDDSPSGRLVHGIMADIAEWYSANLSEEAKKGLRKKVESGGTPGNVPIGYVNERHKIIELGKDIGVVRMHDVFGPIVTECFKRYDTGFCTLADVAEYASEQGLRLRANKRLPERLITVQHMQRLLRNRYYTGWVRFNGVDYRGGHPSLIDEATFDRVQALLDARNVRKDKSHRRPHHLKGTLYCARCGRRLGITVAVKRQSGASYPYFFCLGRHVDKNHCPQGYVSVEAVVAAVRVHWARLRLPDERRSALRQAILAEFAGKHEDGKVEIAKHQRRIIEFEQRRRKAKAAYYADALSLDELKAEQAVVTRGIAAAQEVIARWSVELTSITEALDTALDLTANPLALYDALPEGLKLQLVQTVFEKIWVFDDGVVGSELTQPFLELLTYEARLALTEPRLEGEIHGREIEIPDGDIYGRQRLPHGQAIPRLLSPRSYLSKVERPFGYLAVDRQARRQSGGTSSKIQHMVGATGLNSNSQIANYLRENPVLLKVSLTLSYTPRKWRLRDKLSERDVVRMVMAFQTGMTTRELAERFGINIKSVRKLLRDHCIQTKRREQRDRRV